MERLRVDGWRGIITGLIRGRCLLVAVLSLAAVAICARDARAVPSFARQTGLACSACHTVFPELTPFGRQFKLFGYTAQGMKELEEAGTQQAPPLSINRVFPLSVMFQTSLTRTNRSQPGTQNGNVEFPQQISLFLAGEIAPHLGAFVQATYDGQADHFSLDNTDIRYSNSTRVGGKELVYGVTLNNNPTVEDLWHTTPVWGWPFANADSAATPAASALVDGALAQQVAGIGAFSMWNKHLYGAAAIYRSAHIGSTQPPSSTDSDTIHDVAPYWRLAWQQNLGLNYFEVGTYGMFAQLFPTGVSNGTNKYTDVAFDAQYERPFGKDFLSVHTTYIFERQQLDATFGAGNSSNRIDRLHTFRIDGIYHVRSRVSLGLGYFQTAGTSDATLYAPAQLTGSTNGKPDSSGMTAEIAVFPWQNVRVSLLYTPYFEFNGRTHNYDGSGRDAANNNTLYLLAWIMF
jgi:hypothetical protein